LTAAPNGLQIKPVSDVESYDEESHVCRLNDTPENLSQEYYHTPRYARALVLFNRDHPRAADGIKQEPPQMPAGQVLYIPPARVLDKNYQSAIGESPSPAAIGTLAPPPMPSSAPPAPSAAGVRLYSIRQQNGEWLYQIAQRTLGTGDRWYDIARLNPQFKPEQPVPFGQQLKLPADAKIEASDAP
jgi:nucleoid-associated protein YgaU